MTIDTLLSLLLPDTLTLSQGLLLLATSFAAALLTAILGVGGGVLLLAVIASILPPLAIIPVHGLVQAAANGNRAFLTRQHLNCHVFKHFVIGSVLGAILASLLVVQLPTHAILLCIGLFILLLTWGPKLRFQTTGPWSLRFAASLTTFVSMFVGASGPLVATFTQQLTHNRFQQVATFSACMSVQHSLKLAVFGFLGFSFSDWLPLVLSMILTGVAGTWIGLNLLTKISNERFNQVFKVILTLMAVKLLYSALSGLLGF